MICWKLRGFVSDNFRAFFANAIFTRCFGEGGQQGQGRNGLICDLIRHAALVSAPREIFSSGPGS